MVKEGYRKVTSLKSSIGVAQAHAAVCPSQNQVYSRFLLSRDGWYWKQVLN